MPCCAKEKRRVLIIGAQFTGTFAARELKKNFHVVVVDAKEYFEYTPGVLRAFVKPAHFDALTFNLQAVVERKMGVKFIWGEVMELKPGAASEEREAINPGTATVKTMFAGTDTIQFDYCMICSGCNFGVLHKAGESLWFPTVHQREFEFSTWKHIDERYIEGRRRHILEEYHKIQALAKANSKVLVVGAGFIGVEWVTELQHYFPALKLTIIDFLPRCLGPLPESAAGYCSEYMHAHGIDEHYELKYDASSADFWKRCNLEYQGVDETYVCMGVKASNYFMPDETLSKGGPGGGKWINMNMALQVTGQPDSTGAGLLPGEGVVWGNGHVFAVGDCNTGGIGAPNKNDAKKMDWTLNPIPKISYPGEEQAMHACHNIAILDKKRFGGHCHCSNCFGLCMANKLMKTWWPWGAGMFATSLGPHDAAFVFAANHEKGSGYMVNWWLPGAIQKEFIETTKIDECKDNCIGIMIWHFVHHTPVNCWGKGRGFKQWGM